MFVLFVSVSYYTKSFSTPLWFAKTAFYLNIYKQTILKARITVSISTHRLESSSPSLCRGSPFFGKYRALKLPLCCGNFFSDMCHYCNLYAAAPQLKMSSICEQISAYKRVILTPRLRRPPAPQLQARPCAAIRGAAHIVSVKPRQVFQVKSSFLVKIHRHFRANWYDIGIRYFRSYPKNWSLHLCIYLKKK